jgi:hypothetical protein
MLDKYDRMSIVKAILFNREIRKDLLVKWIKESKDYHQLKQDWFESIPK